MWRSFEYHAQDLWRSVYENRPRAHLGGGARSFARALTNAAWIFPRRSGLRPFELSWVSTDSQHSSQQQGAKFPRVRRDRSSKEEVGCDVEKSSERGGFPQIGRTLRAFTGGKKRVEYTPARNCAAERPTHECTGNSGKRTRGKPSNGIYGNEIGVVE